MATIDEKIEALEDALSRGVKTVSYGSEQVTYHSPESIERALAYLRAKKSEQLRRPTVRVTRGGFFR